MQNTIKQITEAPELIKQAELDILEIKNSIATLKEQLTTICRTVACEVAAETSEGGKKAFSNAEAREAETEKRLRQNEEYLLLKKSVSEIETKKAQEEIGLQFIKDQYSANRYKARLHCADKIEKAANSFLGGMQILAGLDKLLTRLNSNNLSSDTSGENLEDVPFNCPL